MSRLGAKASSVKPTSIKLLKVEGIHAPVEIRRHPTARRLTLRISRTQRSVVLTIPRNSDLREADRFLARSLDWVRERLVALAKTGTPEALKKAFDVKELALAKARAEALALDRPPPLLPALSRYTGVAFQALDAASLSPETWTQVYILSTLRGLVRGDEPVPPYKLKLGAIPGLKAHWRATLATAS